MEDSWMEEANAKILSYVLGGIFPLSKYLGSPYFSCVLCDDWVRHLGFVQTEVVGESISTPSLTSSPYESN
jgi:hypothetical protein